MVPFLPTLKIPSSTYTGTLVPRTLLKYSLASFISIRGKDSSSSFVAVIGVGVVPPSSGKSPKLRLDSSSGVPSSFVRVSSSFSSSKREVCVPSVVGAVVAILFSTSAVLSVNIACSSLVRGLPATILLAK